MKIGIFFGGKAREREISYAGGKTAMANIDKSIFEPIPVFVDSCGRFILLKEEYLYKSSIREFYPPEAFQPKPYRVYVESLINLDKNSIATMIAGIGQEITPDQFVNYFDFAFIAMHGPTAEDGSIQGLLEWYGIPYSGPGILGSGVGIDKIAQNEMLKLAVGLDKKTATLSFNDWYTKDRTKLFESVKNKVGLPFVVKAPHQGSSIGVAFVKKDDIVQFEIAVGQCLFVKDLHASNWNTLSELEKEDFIQKMVDLDTGIAMPLAINNELIYEPAVLKQKIDLILSKEANVTLVSSDAEHNVLFESFVEGQEFSCGVIQNDLGESIALPPTEIVKVVEVFDFNSKYKPGATRKNIPVKTSLDHNLKIQNEVKTAFDKLGFGVCTRIDGFLTPEGQVILHDPNTIPGMSPTSLIFKQMAEIGLNVTEAITYFIRQSVFERLKSGKNTVALNIVLNKLDKKIADRKESFSQRIEETITITGQNLEELDTSYALARTTFGKIASSKDKKAKVVLLYKDHKCELAVQYMFKDYAEDLIKLLETGTHPLIANTRNLAQKITQKYASQITFEVIKLS